MSMNPEETARRTNPGPDFSGGEVTESQEAERSNPGPDSGDYPDGPVFGNPGPGTDAEESVADEARAARSNPGPNDI